MRRARTERRLSHPAQYRRDSIPKFCKRLLAVGKSVRENGCTGFFLEVLPVKSRSNSTKLTRRQMLRRTGKAMAGSVAMAPLIQSAILSSAAAAETGLKGVAGIDRVTILPGKTYLRG